MWGKRGEGTQSCFWGVGQVTLRPHHPTVPARSKAGRARGILECLELHGPGNMAMGRVTKATSVPTEGTSLLKSRHSDRGVSCFPKVLFQEVKETQNPNRRCSAGFGWGGRAVQCCSHHLSAAGPRASPNPPAAPADPRPSPALPSLWGDAWCCNSTLSCFSVPVQFPGLAAGIPSLCG